MGAGRPREIRGGGGHFTVYVNPQLVEEFERTLPRKKSVSEALREYMESVISEKEKNGEARPDLSALAGLNPSRSNKDMGVNEDLRKFFPRIIDIDDLQELREINLTGQEITRLTGKKIGDKLGENTIKKETVLPFSYDRTKLNI
jgi:hypothetical protein